MSDMSLLYLTELTIQHLAWDLALAPRERRSCPTIIISTRPLYLWFCNSFHMSITYTTRYIFLLTLITMNIITIRCQIYVGYQFIGI